MSLTLSTRFTPPDSLCSVENELRLTCCGLFRTISTRSVEIVRRLDGIATCDCVLRCNDLSFSVDVDTFTGQSEGELVVSGWYDCGFSGSDDSGITLGAFLVAMLGIGELSVDVSNSDGSEKLRDEAERQWFELT
jgi:hypothetical protein